MRKLKLLIAAALTMGAAVSTDAAKTVYLVPGAWDDANATERYELYMFTDGVGSAWTHFEAVGDGTFRATFDDTYQNMVFVRADGGTTFDEENVWTTKWAQTENIPAPFADGLTYTMSGNDGTNNANNTYYISAYLYNPTTGLFLSRGAGYGTACWADNFGIPIIFVANDGGYRLQYMDQTDQYVSDAYWSWADGGTNRAQTYTVSAVEGGYKFINKAHGDANLTLYIAEGADGSFTHQIASNGKYGDNCKENWDVWQMKTSAQREAIVAEKKATAEAALATACGYTLSDGQTLKNLVEDANTFAASVKTSSIINAALTGDYSNGWTYTKKNSGSDPTTKNSDGVEVYQGCGTFSQTVTGLANGLYKVTVQAFYRDGWNERCSELSNNGWKLGNAYLEANGNQTMIADWASDRAADNNPNGTGQAKTLFNAGKYVNEVFAQVTDGNLTISIAQPGGAVAGRWFFLSNATLTYYSDQVSDEDATAIIAQAEALDGKVMQMSLATAVTEAKTTFEGAKTIANYNALSEAVTAAQASVNAYANAKAYLDEAETILANTNVYTATAYATYFLEPKAKYEARTLTTEEANALVKSTTGWHSVNTIDEILLSAWTIGGEQCVNYDKGLYINTWSVEGNTDGSNFLAPFFEYWVDDKQSLGANSIVATVTGLKANTTYSFTIRARVRQTNNATKIANGITMKVGEGTAVDISSGAQFNGGQFYIGNFTAMGETDAEGKLTVTITVAENSNISWLSFYNAKYTEGEDLSAYIADYEFALSVADANSKNAAYAAVTGKEKADLTAALTTYANVDNTDKAALIAAKEALESVSAAFVAAAPTYKAFAELNKNVAAALAVTMPTITDETTAADLKVSEYVVAEYNAAKAYTNDVTSKLGEWTNAPGTNKGESWNGDGNDTYYDLYNSADRAMTQSVTLPKGDYVLIAKGRASANGLLTLTDGTETITFAHKGSTGRGIATDGTATFAEDATYANSNNGRGWEYRVLPFTSDGENAITLTFNWTTANSNWVGLDDIELRCNAAAFAVVGAVVGTSDIFSGNWDAATTTDILSESEGVYTKTYADVELDKQTIEYKVISKSAVESTEALAWYDNNTGKNLTIDIPVKGLYDITFTFNGTTVTGEATKTAEAVVIGDKKWATTVTNSPLDFSKQTDFRAYTATVSGDNVTLAQVTNVQAETGLVLHGTAGTYYLPVIESSTTDKGELMHSSIYKYDLTDEELSKYTFYGLTVNDDDKAQFVKISGTSIAPQKAFLRVENTGSTARELKVVFAGETTGIDSIAAETVAAEGVYNLNGQRVNAPAKKGLYIVNGKKVILK